MNVAVGFNPRLELLRPTFRRRAPRHHLLPQPIQPLAILLQFLVAHRRVMVGLRQIQHLLGARIRVRDLLLTVRRHDAVLPGRDEDGRGGGTGRIADGTQLRRDLPREQMDARLQGPPTEASQHDLSQGRRIAEDQAGQRMTRGQIQALTQPKLLPVMTIGRPAACVCSCSRTASATAAVLRRLAVPLLPPYPGGFTVHNSTPSPGQASAG